MSDTIDHGYMTVLSTLLECDNNAVAVFVHISRAFYAPKMLLHGPHHSLMSKLLALSAPGKRSVCRLLLAQDINDIYRDMPLELLHFDTYDDWHQYYTVAYINRLVRSGDEPQIMAEFYNLRVTDQEEMRHMLFSTTRGIHNSVVPSTTHPTSGAMVSGIITGMYQCADYKAWYNLYLASLVDRATSAGTLPDAMEYFFEHPRTTRADVRDMLRSTRGPMIQDIVNGLSHFDTFADWYKFDQETTDYVDFLNTE